MYRPQLLSLSVHGCEFVEESLCKHLCSCVALDICGTGINNEGLHTLAEVSSMITTDILCEALMIIKIVQITAAAKQGMCTQGS